MGDCDSLGLGMHSLGGSGHSVPSRPMKCPAETALVVGSAKSRPRPGTVGGCAHVLGPQLGEFAMSSGAGGHARVSFSERCRAVTSWIFSTMPLILWDELWRR